MEVKRHATLRKQGLCYKMHLQDSQQERQKALLKECRMAPYFER
jgi:hypothetical protein